MGKLQYHYLVRGGENDLDKNKKSKVWVMPCEATASHQVQVMPNMCILIQGICLIHEVCLRYKKINHLQCVGLDRCRRINDPGVEWKRIKYSSPQKVTGHCIPLKWLGCCGKKCTPNFHKVFPDPTW
jgi:hypothetical protein